MRNIFDQYSQPENRLTHALICCLSEDKKLLRNFIRWVTGSISPSTKYLEIVEQHLPGETEITEEESERRGLPDGWIHDNDKWSLIIESKVAATFKNDQLRRHLQIASRRGFEDITLLAIGTTEPRRKLIDGVIFKKWSEIYTWLNKQGTDWALKTTRYMEIAESKWTNDDYLKEGTLTTFSGIPFTDKNPYNYPEAKRLIRLAIDGLRKRKDLKNILGIDPTGVGRGMITGKASSGVWDFLRLKDFKNEGDFTKTLHLTLSIQSDSVFAAITIPNNIKSVYRRNLLEGGYDCFREVFKKVHRNMSKKLRKVEGSMSWVGVVQRHYRTQSSPPIVDARLDFNLDTAFKDTSFSDIDRVKQQPVWLESAYESIAKKRHSNTQLVVGAIFPYSRCLAVHSPKILNHIASVWISCNPLIKCVIGK